MNQGRLLAAYLRLTSVRFNLPGHPLVLARYVEDFHAIEELQVGKRQVQRGGVRVYSRLTETPVEETVQLREEQVKVDRRPVDRPAARPIWPASARATAEEPVVSKQARVVEEVVVGKEVSERTETVRDTVRRTEVEVEKVASALAGDKRYGKSDWEGVEPEARRRWEESHPGAWEEFKDTMRSAWDKVRGGASSQIVSRSDGLPDLAFFGRLLLPTFLTKVSESWNTYRIGLPFPV